jgi:tetratricopeptide (TPR) repeat protein
LEELAVPVAVIGGVLTILGLVFGWFASAWRYLRGRRRPTRQAAPSPLAAPTVTDLPRVPPRNPDFTGREEELKALRQSLLAGGTAALTQAITGLGGVGKTQLAAEYAYRYRDGYDHILWVRSEEPAQLADDFAGLAKLLDLPEQDEQDQRVIHQAVCQWLATHDRWLLSFDNAPHPDSLKGYRPEEGHGHVVITSRDPDWAGVATPLKVEVWEPDESLEFLGKRLGRTDEAAAELAKELGHLPLALAQAAAYIKNAGMWLEDYLKLYRDRREELWKDEKPPPEYPEAVGTTWSVAFEAAHKEEPPAADLLNLCAFLASDDIPRDLLAKAMEDPLALNRAISALQHYSLIRTDDDSISVHRLVQAVTRDRLSEEERKEWAAAVVRLLDAALPFKQDDPDTWRESGRLLPHALAAAEHAVGAQVGGIEPPRVLSDAGTYLTCRAEFGEAKRVLERAVTVAEETYGSNHPYFATCLNNLGHALWQFGDAEGAKEHYQRALAIAEEAFGPDHPGVATFASNLGSALHDLGDLKGACQHCERALAIDEKTYGPDHPVVAIDANNLGGVLQGMGDLKGAKAHYERALLIDEKAYGPGHPSVAVRLNNLGTVVEDLGDLEGAKQHYQRALTIDEQAYGRDHPSVARDANNLGHVLHNMGNLEGAREHCERAVAIDERAYGPDHPTVATHVNNLGLVLEDMGDLEGAKEHFERALATDEKAYGPDHPEVARDLSNLGSLLAGVGDQVEARKCFERALAIRLKFLGEDHPRTQMVRGKLEALDKGEG